MMNILLMLVFMMPLSFMKLSFWFNQCLFMLVGLLMVSHFNVGVSFSSVRYNWGVDMLSFMMIMLKFGICSLMVMASESIFKSGYYYNSFLFVLLILLISLVCTFSSLKLFIFYLFFEFSLIPTLILIIGWGYQPERIQAGIYLLFYTSVASLPMMIYIFHYSIYGTLDLFFIFGVDYFMLYLCMSLVLFCEDSHMFDSSMAS